MATAQECENALHVLAARLAEKDPKERNTNFERSLTCSITDLGIVFAGRLHDGLLQDIEQTTDAAAQVRLELTGDDLVDMVDGKLNLASAWANGRIKVHAGVFDMMKLRSIL